MTLLTEKLVNMLILDRSPKPFDKHVVHPSAFTIHADLNAVGLQDAVKASLVN